jgi:hypothetical protein
MDSRNSNSYPQKKEKRKKKFKFLVMPSFKELIHHCLLIWFTLGHLPIDCQIDEMFELGTDFLEDTQETQIPWGIRVKFEMCAPSGPCAYAHKRNTPSAPNYLSVLIGT